MTAKEPSPPRGVDGSPRKGDLWCCGLPGLRDERVHHVGAFGGSSWFLVLGTAPRLETECSPCELHPWSLPPRLAGVLLRYRSRSRGQKRTSESFSHDWFA